MANVQVNSFSLELLPGNNVRINVQFSVILTATEIRLGIPSRVALQLRERDGRRDTLRPLADWTAFTTSSEHDDDNATPWYNAGIFYSNMTSNFSRVVPISSLPRESGDEEWYVVIGAAPDILSAINYSEEIVANLVRP